LAALATESEPSRQFAKTFPSSIFVASTLSPIAKAGNTFPSSILIVDGCGASNTVDEIKDLLLLHRDIPWGIGGEDVG